MMKPSLENIIIKENSALDFLSQCLNKEDYVIITEIGRASCREIV